MVGQRSSVEFEQLDKDVKRVKALLALIKDSHKRQATNRSSQYRAEQSLKCKEWLGELTEIYERCPMSFEVENCT